MLLSRPYRLAALPLALLPAAFVMAACAPLYAPNAVNAPLLAGGDEVQGAARLGSNGAGAQAAAALTDHVGVMANASAYPFGERAPAEEPPSDFRHHRLVEGALGYFGHGLFSKERVRYAIWAGYGRGQAEVVSVIDPAVVPGPSVETDEGRFERFFVQVSAGGSRPLGERLQVESAMSLRAARVRFREFRGDATPGDCRGHFLEPAASLRVGTAHLQFEMQSGLSLPLQRAEARGFEADPFFLSMGACACASTRCVSATCFESRPPRATRRAHSTLRICSRTFSISSLMETAWRETVGSLAFAPMVLASRCSS